MFDETLVPASIEAQFWRIDERLAALDRVDVWFAVGGIAAALAIMICAGVCLYLIFRLRRIERELDELRERQREAVISKTENS